MRSWRSVSNKVLFFGRRRSSEDPYRSYSPICRPQEIRWEGRTKEGWKPMTSTSVIATRNRGGFYLRICPQRTTNSATLVLYAHMPPQRGRRDQTTRFRLFNTTKIQTFYFFAVYWKSRYKLLQFRLKRQYPWIIPHSFKVISQILSLQSCQLVRKARFLWG